MKVLQTVEEVKSFLRPQKKEGKSVGLIPTMGFLHEGHLSLIKRAKKENDLVVVSIFVNPTQFGPNEDFDSYPKDLEKDLANCEKEGVDVVFHPSVEDMYDNHLTYIRVEEVSENLCGKTRPIHFQGVATVCNKLFHISFADRAYFGEKDAQQLAVLKKMVKDLNMDIILVPCPIVREADGLAKSSRNKYLNDQERKDAVCLYRGLTRAKEMIAKGVLSKDIIAVIREEIDKVPYAKVDYIEVVDQESLQSVDSVKGDVLVALAVWIGPARLIDNFSYTLGEE